MEGDIVLCAEGGKNYAVGVTVLYSERGEKLKGGRYSVVG